MCTKSDENHPADLHQLPPCRFDIDLVGHFEDGTFGSLAIDMNGRAAFLQLESWIVECRNEFVVWLSPRIDNCDVGSVRIFLVQALALTKRLNSKAPTPHLCCPL